VALKNIMETLTSGANLTLMTKALVSAGLVDELIELGPLTVFAPSDEAFMSMPPGSMEALLKNLPYLQRILYNHMVDGQYDSNHFPRMDAHKTLADTELHVQLKPKVTINGARVVKPNLICTNGIVHIIDHVFMISLTQFAAVSS
jgi:uncharacterized surface protein with fasciclin (FAS1) repeats